MTKLNHRLASVRSRKALLACCAVGLVAIAAGDPAAVQAPFVSPEPAAAAAGKELPVARFNVAAQWASERVGSAMLTIELSAPSSSNVRVPFTTSGSAKRGKDFKVDGHAVVIPAGETSVDIPVTILQDNLEEGPETAIFTLGKATGATTAGHDSFTLAIGTQELGDPVDGLTDDELAAFLAGEEIFLKRFTPEEGLGPFYNAVSCQSCHSKPVMGGAAALYRNFYLAVYQFGPTPASQSSSIPPFLSQVVPAYGSGDLHISSTFTLEGGRPLLPETVLGFPVLATQRNSIPIFGTGLFEFVSNATILSHADPNDVDGDGISGRANTALGGTAMGRLGVKSQSNNVELFTRAPLQNQMGITSNPFLGSAAIVSLPMSALQVSGNPNDPTVDNDGVPDPEISHEDLGNLIAFTRFLAPPLAKPLNADALAGEVLFDQVGCAKCHMPELPSSKGALRPFSDLLVHYMGPDLVDNMKFGEVSNVFEEFRSMPLWGVSQFSPFMHDGRAPTLFKAIDMHAGEAQGARDQFMGLTEDQRDQVITFLEHL
jgi:CxxC motif-containing protein (DUF1111 family)